MHAVASVSSLNQEIFHLLWDRLTHIMPTSQTGFTYKLYKLQLWASHYTGPEWGRLTIKKIEYINNESGFNNLETLTDMRRLRSGMRSEKYVVVGTCTYTNQDGIV